MTLDIPDEARELASVAYDVKHLSRKGHDAAILDALKAGLPLAVAAELDRLAGQIEREAHTPDSMAAQSPAMAALDDAVRQGALAMATLLRARARELRGDTT